MIAARLNTPVRQVALAELTGIEWPSLVRLLDLLCAANLVRRDENPNDRRAKIISLTDEGRLVTAKIEKELIALPAVMNPAGIFDLAVTRTEEILLGIVCASVVGSAILPNRLAPTLIEQTDAWFRDAAFYAKETFSGRMGGKTISACRQRLAVTVNALEFLLSQLAYDHTRPDILARAQALRGRMQLLMPIMSAISDPLAALFNGQKPSPPGLEPLLADIVT